MGRFRRLSIIGLLITVAAFAKGQDTLDLFGTDPVALGANLYAQDATVTLTTGAGPESAYVDATFNGVNKLFGQNYATEQDWSAYDGVELRLSNHGPTSLRFFFRVDSNTSDGTPGWTISGITLPPGSERKFVTYLKRENAPYVLTHHPALLNYPYQGIFNDTNGTNRSRVRSWLMFLSGGPGSLRMSGFRLIKKKADLTGIMDMYGQWTAFNWPGKITSDADLVAAGVAERSALLSTGILSPRAGTTAWPRKAPAVDSKWRLERWNSGHWWLIHPNGNRLWSLGINTIDLESSVQVTNRSLLFNGLPANDDPNFGGFYMNQATSQGNIQAYNYYGANLKRKWGSVWQSRGIDMNGYLRLTRWGFNTIGAYSSQNLYNIGQPYTHILTTDKFPTRLPAPYVYWRQLPDVFAPDFESWLTTNWANWINILKNKPDFMGLFVDSEHGWGLRNTEANSVNLAVGALNAPMTQPSKQHIINFLKSRWGTIQMLNLKWGRNYASWAQLEAANGFGSADGNQPVQLSDLKQWVRQFANKYYQSVRNALTANGFTGLWLGTRDLYSQTPNEVIKAAANFVDTYSFNIYLETSTELEAVNAIDRPVIISEFAFSAVDRGHNALSHPIDSWDQAHRASRVKAYLEKVITYKNIVGAHWFQFTDYPAVGRSRDNTRWQTGLVDLQDNPYTEVVDTFKTFASQMYSLRPSSL